MAIGAITQLWRIGFDDARKPEQSEIDEALKHIDYRKVEFNDDEKTVYLKDKDMIIDLGAIAKGYITDEVVKVLKEQGVTSAIVDLGGNVYVLDIAIVVKTNLGMWGSKIPTKPAVPLLAVSKKPTKRWSLQESMNAI